MGKKDAPDYKGAAEDTAKSELEYLDKSTQANRPNQKNAWGSIDWSQDPSGNWTQTQTLNDNLQGSLDAQQGMQKGRSELAQGMMGSVQDDYSQPMDFDKYGQEQGLEFDPSQLRQRAEDAAYGRATSRLDPRFEQEGESLEVNLRNRGLTEGDAAYDSAMQNFNQSKNDAYGQAQMGAVGQGRAESAQDFQQQMGSTGHTNQLRRNAMGEEMQQRGNSLNEMNTVLGGQGVNAPSFDGFNQAGRSSGVDYLGAMRDKSNFEQGASGGFMKGMMGMGNMGANMYGAGMFGGG